MTTLWRLGTFITDLFVPTNRNGSLPHVLSTIGISACLMAALFLLLTPPYLNISHLASIVQPLTFPKSEVIRLVNDSRTALGLPVLTTNPTLDAAAVAKLDDMLSEQYFAHFSPTGKSPWDFLKGAGYHYVAAGENLAADFVQPSDAHTAFMASPSHRANIMNPVYTEIGVAVAQGMLNGRPTILVVQYFGKPRSFVATSPSQPTTSPTPTPTPTPAPAVAIATPQASTSSVTVASDLRITPAVLGTRIAQGPAPIIVLKQVPDYVKIKLIAFGIMALILVAFFFLFRHHHGIPPVAVTVRTLVVLFVLGYTAFAGVHDWDHPTVTPTSESTILITE